MSKSFVAITGIEKLHLICDSLNESILNCQREAL